MAVLNPQAPDVEPKSYIGLSKPISQPQADTSTEAALKGVGDVFGSAVAATDMVAKKYIENETQTGVDKLQDDYINRLRTVDDAMKGKPPDILASNETGPDPNKPAELNNLPNTLSGMLDSRLNGKVSQTKFDGDMRALAKQLRSAHPGYRDFIDETFDRTAKSGYANQYITSMIGDINAGLSNIQAERNKVISQLEQVSGSHFDVGGQDITAIQVINNIRHGGSVDMGWQYVGMANRGKWDYEQKKMALDNVKTDKEGTAIVADQLATTAGQNEINKTMFTITGGNGLTASQTIDHLHKMGTGEVPVDEMQAREFTQNLAVQRNNAAAALRAKFDKDGLTVALGGEEARDKKINGLLKTYDEIITYSSNKDYGAIAQVANTSSAISNNDYLKAQSGDNPLGVTLRMWKILSKDSNPQLMGEWSQYVLGKKDFPEMFKGLQTTLSTSLLTQPSRNSSGDPALDSTTAPFLPRAGQVMPVKKAIQITKDAPGGTSLRNADVFQSYLDLKQFISRSDVPLDKRVNLAEAFFDPSNQGMVSEFAREGINPKTGKRVLVGQYAAFSGLLSEDVLKGVYKTSQEAGRPDIWHNTQNWAETTFGNELFRGEIATLNGASNIKGAKLDWDEATHNLKFTEPPTVTSRGRVIDDKMSRDVREAVQRVNIGLNGMYNIGKVDPNSNPDTYIKSLLKASNLNLEALANPKEPGTLNYDLEPVAPNLDSFLKNPTGGHQPLTTSYTLTGDHRQALEKIISEGEWQDVPEGMTIQDFLRQTNPKNKK